MSTRPRCSFVSCLLWILTLAAPSSILWAADCRIVLPDEFEENSLQLEVETSNLAEHVSISIDGHGCGGTLTTAPFKATCPLSDRMKGDLRIEAIVQRRDGTVARCDETLHIYQPPTVQIVHPVENSLLAAGGSTDVKVQGRAGSRPLEAITIFLNGEEVSWTANSIPPGAEFGHKIVLPAIHLTPGWNSIGVSAVDAVGEGEATVRIQLDAPVRQDNGIFVGRAKLYDRWALQASARRLVQSINGNTFYDRAAIAAAISNFQGARRDTSFTGLRALGLPVPGSTEKMGYNQPADEEDDENRVDTQSSETTRGQIDPFVPQTPDSTSAFTFNPPFGLAPQTLLSQQVEATYQLVNLQFLLEESLTDRFIEVPGLEYRQPRERVVVGFRISLDPSPSLKKAVAEVEITAKPVNQSASGKVSLMSLIPQEGTYNVATVTNKRHQFGFGLPIQPLNIGFGSDRTKERLYLVQDRDTVALERGSNGTDARFAWQFRPVLGQKVVAGGLRHVFSVLALPSIESSPQGSQFKLQAKTQWRRYNLKSKTVGDPIHGTERIEDLGILSIGDKGLASHQAPAVGSVVIDQLKDGRLSIWVDGENFLEGTSVTLGGQQFNEASPAVRIVSDKKLHLTLPVDQLFSTALYVVGRTGMRTPIISPLPRGDQTWGLKIQRDAVEAKPWDAERVQLIIPVRSSSGECFETAESVLLKLEDEIYLARTEQSQINLIVPRRVLGKAHNLLAKRPFFGDPREGFDLEFEDQFVLRLSEMFPGTGEPPLSASGVRILSQDTEKVQLAISGSGFRDMLEIRLGGDCFHCTTTPGDCWIRTGNLLLLTVAKASLGKTKSLLLIQESEPPIFLAAPGVKVELPKPSVSNGPLQVAENDENDVEVEGKNLKSVAKAVFQDKELPFKVTDKDGQRARLRLHRSLTGKPGRKTVDLVSKDGKVLANLQVKVSPRG